MIDSIVFWQRMQTPHMTELACELARLKINVVFVAEQELSVERRAMGWTLGGLHGVATYFVASANDAVNLADSFPSTAVHITQGVRSNGLIAHAQKRLVALGRRQFPIIEKVDLRGSHSLIKEILYAFRFWSIADSVEGILAIGEGTSAWIRRHAPRRMQVYPFAYFLAGSRILRHKSEPNSFRLIFTGALVKRKRVDLLLHALCGHRDRPFTLDIVGDGPERASLERFCKAELPGRVVFHGTLSMDRAACCIAESDCLVLPSDHDGWGAVVSEAQINGTPAICSTECGACGTVRASGTGAVFAAGDLVSLQDCLRAVLDRGPLRQEERERLAQWAQCLTAKEGARYLLEILNRASSPPLVPPWLRG